MNPEKKAKIIKIILGLCIAAIGVQSFLANRKILRSKKC